MDDRKFQEIKGEYDKFYASLLREGKLPLRSTEKGFWGHMPAADLYGAFKRLDLKRHQTFIDLGSGDGKAVLIASLFCKRALGVEFDQELFLKSIEMQKNLRIGNALFYNHDFYDHGITGIDHVFLYPDEPLHRKLESKLQKEMSGKLIHCGHHFHPKNLRKLDEVWVNGNLFTVYSR